MNVLAVVHEADAGSGVFGEFPTWVPSEGPPPEDGFDALMVFGGSMHIDQNDEHRWLDSEKRFLRDALERGVPILGVCLGSQMLAEAAGSVPYRSEEPEIGWVEVEVTDAGAADPVIGPLAPSARLFAWHHYVAPLPAGALELARTSHSVHAFRIEGKPAWGLQFHAEVTLEDLRSWLSGLGASEPIPPELDPEQLRSESEERIAAQNELGRALARRFLAEAERWTSR